MQNVHPDLELAPRDIVARAIYAQTQAGLRPMLDTRDCLGPRITEEFPAVAAACQRNGIDPVHQPIPVAAAAHYHMGGIASDRHGRTSLAGLWVAGEAASTGLHGANRLASNGLLEAVVFAEAAARDIANTLPDDADDLPPVHVPPLAQADGPAPHLIGRLRRVMTEGAGVVRHEDGLHACLHEIAAIEASQPDCEALQNMTAAATLIAAAALARRESRGAHYRSDFPQPEGAKGQRSSMTLAEAIRLRPAPQET